MTDYKQGLILRLKQLRMCLGLSSKDFSLKAGIDPRNYSSIENGNRAIGDRVIRDITDAFSVNYDWLITGEGDIFTQKKDPQLNNVEPLKNDEMVNKLIEMLSNRDEELRKKNEQIDRLLTLIESMHDIDHLKEKKMVG